MNLIIVDDNKNFLEAASFFIESKLGYSVIEQYSSPLAFLKSEKISQIDCVLIDIEMPVINGINAAKMVLKQYPYMRFIAITNHSEKAYLLELIGAGFKGCVFKNGLFSQLPEALIKVVNDELYFPQNIKL